MIQSTAYRTNRRGEINHFGEEDSQTIQNRNRNQSQSVAARNNQQHQRIMCGRCGAVGHGGNECRRSKNATCNTCGKIGHFQRMCKYKQSSNHRGGQTSSHHRQPPANRTRSGVNQVTEDTSFETYETNDIQNQSNESDNEYKDFTIHKIGEQNHFLKLPSTITPYQHLSTLDHQSIFLTKKLSICSHQDQTFSNHNLESFLMGHQNQSIPLEYSQLTFNHMANQSTQNFS